MLARKPGHRAVPSLRPVCLPRLPQLNVTHEGRCWGPGQWRSGLKAVSTPQTHSARYCFFGGRTHPAVTLGLAWPVARFLMRSPLCLRCPPCPHATCNLVLVVPPPSLSPSGPLAPPAFLPAQFHHLLLFEPSLALELWFARQHYSPPSCPLPATLHCLPSHQIVFRPRPGWPPMCDSHVLFWSGPSGRKYKST